MDMTITITADIAASIATSIPAPYGALWGSLRSDLTGAPLGEVTTALQSAQFEAWQSGAPEDADLIATARACQAVLAQLTPPATRGGLTEVAQIIGEVGVVAGAVRWTAAAIGQQIQRARDARRAERDAAVERTDLIELY
jgi:hypothetical protein